MPTVLELAGRSDLTPKDTDGISMVNELLQKGRQRQHEYLYWEGHGGKGGVKVVRYGDYKALAFVDTEQKVKEFELYDLASDIGEENNIAEERPDIVKKIKRIMADAHTDSEHFNFGGEEPKREEFIQYLREKSAELKEQDK
jgi:arylsulfatase A-like enzyme